MVRWIRQRRVRQLAPVLAERARLEEALCEPGEIEAWQLARFNERWAEIRRNVPYFSGLDAPESFRSWSEVGERLPIMDRSVVQREGARLTDGRRPGEYFRTTGGSTAEPVQMPAWTSEQAVNGAAMWQARSWLGITPADSLFLLWGHSHLLGRGLRAVVNGRLRQLKDRVCGYTRWSAYDLGTPALRAAAEALLAARPAWLLGYSVGLDRFARVNDDRREELSALGLKAVVATAESFPSADSAARIAALFDCPVLMEYGAVEAGVLAHQHPADGIFHVLWQDHHIEAQPSADGPPGSVEILVTSLFPRACPLVRYRMGDLVVPVEGRPVSVAFASVTGRCNDAVVLPDGRAIHSESFTHAVKDCPAVLGYQVVQEQDGLLRLDCLSSLPLADPVLADLRRRLSLIDPALASIDIRRVDALQQTRAGKTRAVIRL